MHSGARDQHRHGHRDRQRGRVRGTGAQQGRRAQRAGPARLIPSLIHWRLFMPRFAANLSMLFTEVPFLERFERAAQAGFEAVEFLFPYAHQVDEIRERLDATGLEIVLHNLPAGDWDAGERGIAVDPARVDEFRAGVSKAVRSEEHTSELQSP